MTQGLYPPLLLPAATGGGGGGTGAAAPFSSELVGVDGAPYCVENPAGTFTQWLRREVRQLSEITGATTTTIEWTRNGTWAVTVPAGTIRVGSCTADVAVTNTEHRCWMFTRPTGVTLEEFIVTLNDAGRVVGVTDINDASTVIAAVTATVLNTNAAWWQANYDATITAALPTVCSCGPASTPETVEVYRLAWDQIGTAIATTRPVGGPTVDGDPGDTVTISGSISSVTWVWLPGSAPVPDPGDPLVMLNPTVTVNGLSYVLDPAASPIFSQPQSLGASSEAGIATEFVFQADNGAHVEVTVFRR
jgi:hypothetical protein